MPKKVALDQQNVFVKIRLLNDSDGTPATSVVAATAGHEMWYWRDSAAAVVTDSTSAADMSALDDAHVDWEFLHIREGLYWCAFPDAAFANGAGQVACGMNATGITGIVETVTIEPLFKFQGQASSVTATTTTFPAGPVVHQGDTIYVPAGTGIGQTRLITSVSGQIATHEAWDVNISATTSTVLLIAGDETLGDGGINADVATSTRSDITPAQVNAENDTALADFFPNGPGVAVDVNVESVAGVSVDGTGEDSDPWGPV